MMQQQHFLTLLSPGTFVHEETVKPVDAWDIDAAVEMAKTVVERHNATPFAFQFSTRGRKDDELDSREIARSPRYYLGGTIETLEEIKARNDPSDRIVIENMKCNGWDRVITNTNSWKLTQPLGAEDVVLVFDSTPAREENA